MSEPIYIHGDIKVKELRKKFAKETGNNWYGWSSLITESYIKWLEKKYLDE